MRDKIAWNIPFVSYFMQMIVCSQAALQNSVEKVSQNVNKPTVFCILGALLYSPRTGKSDRTSFTYRIADFVEEC